MNRALKSSILWLKLLLYIGGTTILLASCTLKELSPERPVISESKTSRGFFEYKAKNGRVKLKTFLAGWSPEMTAGEYQSYIFDHYNHAGHANVVFEVTEGNLVGKMVIASFITDQEDCLDRDSEKAKACRARWPNVVTIPITKHFYYERKKDSRGRTTDELIENDQRSHWSARPFLNLNLGGVNIKDFGMQLMWPNMSVDSVEDIEWDNKKSFLGFTVTATHPLGGSAIQGRFRFNFLAFEHNPNFKKTPYRPANAKHINVLHVISNYVDGDMENPIMMAAHWDTGPNVQHEISLYGFPKEYEKIGFDVLEQWNDAFEKVGRGRPFKPVVSDRKYAFDLRYPTIAWISDRRLSMNAPLGVGMAQADVRNGEIKWGMVTMWTGALEHYINAYSPNAEIAASNESYGNSANGGKPVIQLGLMEPQRLLPGSRSSIPQELMTPLSVDAVKSSLSQSFAQEASGLEALTQKVSAAQSVPELLKTIGLSDNNPIEALAQSYEGLTSQVSKETLNEILNQKKETLNSVLNNKVLKNKTAILDLMSRELSQISGKFQMMAMQNGPTEKIFNNDYVQKLIGMPKLSESTSSLPTYDQKNLQYKLSQRSDLTKSEMLSLLNSYPQVSERWSPAAFDADRTFAKVAGAWAMGISKGNIDKKEAFRAIIKSVMLHEWGHVVGMGHNFKENILPSNELLPTNSQKMGWINEKGQLEPYSYKQIEKDAHNEFTNYTSVMGYMSGESEIAIPYDDWKIGPADLISLHYLYNQQYPVYDKKQMGKGDIEFEALKADGLIRENVVKNGVKLSPAFFPACNDFYASMGVDPYCNRWDRGYNATTLVENYIESLKGNLVSSLNAFSNTVKGSAYWVNEGMLWHKFLDNFARVRLFYDYMRQTYDGDIKVLLAGGSDIGVQNLLDFSETCQKVKKSEPSANSQLEQLFKSKPELLDLCVANAKAISEFDSFLQLPGRDYTQIDYMDKYMAYVSGGEGSGTVKNAFGTWKELARTPIKISALMTLTSPYPFSFRDGWVWPVEQYSREDGAYHYSTLYPREYTTAIANATEMNLNFGNPSLDEKTSIGRTVLSMGYYLYNSIGSNDVLSVNAPFIENIRNQTQFRYSWAMVDVTRKDEQNKEIARKFTGTVHNMYSVGAEHLPELYMYKENRIVMMPPPRSLLLPVSPIRWYTKSAGYYFAMKLDYADDYYDKLKKAKSVRKTLEEKYSELMLKCIQGENRNGLRFFFNDSVETDRFPGFVFPSTISDRTEDEDLFHASVDEQFKRYYSPESKFATTPNPATCEEAIRGQALLVMAASVLNGYYLYNYTDYTEKGYGW